MYKTTEIGPEGMSFCYDGHEFSLVPIMDTAVAVMFKRPLWQGGNWDYYGEAPYESVAEACKAIFYGTILVDRTESGRLVFDEAGNIIDLVPLTYYDRAA